MKVCMFIWNFWPGPEGGMERQCRKQAKALVRIGVDCTILTRWPNLSAPRVETDDGLSLVRIGILNPLMGWFLHHKDAMKRNAAVTRSAELVAKEQADELREEQKYGWLTPLRWLNYLFFMMGAFLYFRRHRNSFDVIHVHGGCWMPGFAAWCFRGARTVVIAKEGTYPGLRSLDRELPFRGVLENWRRRSRYIAVHEEAAQDLMQKGIARERIVVIPNGVELPAEVANVGQNDVVLYVGNFTQGSHQKGFDTLIEAWSLVSAKYQQFKLIMLGYGDHSLWRKYAQEKDCDASVEFPGGSNNVAEYYRNAAIMILPSFIEGMSNALLESQSWGIPAVASDIAGNRGVIENEKNGLLFPPGDAQACALVLEMLLKDPERRIQMGQEARMRIEQSFSMNKIAEQIHQAYNKLHFR